jgi:TonB family protein
MMQPLRLIFRNFARATLFSIFAIATATQAQDAPTYQSQVNTLADQLVSDIHAYARKVNISPEVLVVDFVNQRGDMNVFGQQLADALANALQSRLTTEELVPRQVFRQRLISSGYAPFDLRDRDVLSSTAANAAANIIITGRIFVFRNSNTLQIQLTTVPEGQSFSSASADFPAPPGFKTLLATALDWPILPYALTHCTKIPGVARASDAFAALGVTMPKCNKCSPPEYDDDARRARWEGSVLLNVMIDERGQVSSITVAQNAPYGIEHQAIKAVTKWRFDPATQNNKAIQACTQIQVQFRLSK